MTMFAPQQGYGQQRQFGATLVFLISLFSFLPRERYQRLWTMDEITENTLVAVDSTVAATSVLPLVVDIRRVDTLDSDSRDPPRSEMEEVSRVIEVRVRVRGVQSE